MVAKPSISPVAGAPGLDSVRSALAGGGEMGRLMRTFRWQDTSLGPVSSWPPSLRTAVRIILNSRYAMFIWWGPELLNLYNDSCRVFPGAKHPAALGRSARDVWPEIWDQIGPRADAVLLRGESTFDKALLLMMARHGYVEETYFTFSCSPLPADNGRVGGIFCAVTEETEGVIHERRLTLLWEITASMADAHTPGEVCRAAARRLEEARRDLPFTLLYLLEADGETLTCAGEAGIDCGHPAAVRSLSGNDAAWPLRKVIESGEPAMVHNLRERFPDLPQGEWDQPPDSSVLMPIAQQGQKRPAGVLVAGLNPHRRFDAQFRGFVSVLSAQIARALANANAYEAERHRAVELAAEREARLHAEAEAERQRFSEILKYSPAAVGLLSGPELRWSFVNDFYVRVTGRRSAEEFLGKTMAEALPELEGQGFAELLNNVYRTGEAYVGLEAKVGLRRGPNQQLQEGYFNFVYQPIRAASGEIQGILVHAMDVTDQVIARIATEANQQRLEGALVASQRLAAIVESSDDAIISKNLKGIVTSWNPAAEQIFGYTAEEMVGRSILTIIPPELHGDEERILQTIVAGRRIEHFETVRLTKDGRRIDVSLTISPVRNDAGVIVGAAKIGRDITKRRQTEHALRMTERLASVGRLAASIAHEINNPLEGLTNLVYLAKQNTAEPNTRDLLRSAEEELARVSLLTRQTLGFYRERASARSFTVSSLLTPLIAAYMSRIRNKGIILQPEIRQDPEICGVAGEIRQVIANLLSNSIDALPPGGRIRVRISAGRRWNGQQQRGVRLTVADTGTGIPPEARKRIYQPFFTTKKDTGTGLGLWVCNSIVEKHGGRISLLSSTAPGRSGTAFSIFLPLDGVKPAQP